VVTASYFGIGIAKSLVLGGLHYEFMAMVNRVVSWRVCSIVVSVLEGVRFCS
jgi:hypothetical protein